MDILKKIEKIDDDFKKLRIYFLLKYPNDSNYIVEKWMIVDSLISGSLLTFNNFFNEKRDHVVDLFEMKKVNNIDEYFDKVDSYLKSFVIEMEKFLNK